MRILRYDLIRSPATTLSASPSPLSGSGTAQLAKDDRTVFRTTGLSTQTISATFGSASTVSMVALCQHNLSSAATIRVQLYSDTGLTTQIADSGTVTAFNEAAFAAPFDGLAATYRTLKNTVVYLPEQTTVRGIKVTLSDAGNLDGFMEARRLLAGQYFQPKRGPGFGATVLPASGSRVSRADSDSRRADARDKWREMAITLGTIEADDLDDWVPITYYHDKVLCTFVDIYPGDLTAKGILHRLCGGFDDMGPFEAATFGIHRLPIKLGEL